MHLETIAEFVELCKYMNFTRAAEKSNTTQPALSYHIMALEKELGFKLIDRKKPLAITPAGKRFFSGVEPMLNRYFELVEECKTEAEEGKVRGRITVKEPTVVLGKANMAFHIALAEFCSKNKEVDVVWLPGGPFNALDEMVEGRYDCLLTYQFAGEASILDEFYSGTNREAFSNIEYFPIATILLCARVKNDGAFADKDTISLRDIQGFAIPYDYRIENDEVTYSFARTAELYHLDVEMRPRILSMSGEVDTAFGDDELFLAESSYPIAGNVSRKQFKEKPELVYHVAIYQPDRNEALIALKEFLKERPIEQIV
jgi:DNA-binding transcriptional LysR family regulator